LWSFVLLLAAALIPLGLSLWTYESQVFIILAIPPILFIARPISRLRVGTAAAAWYCLPATYAWQTVERYRAAGGTTYQETVLRPDMSPMGVVGDWGVHIRQSLQFWEWTSTIPVYGEAILAPVI